MGGRMTLEDKVLICVDCENEFIFTVGEQEFYTERGFENEPKRCSPCRVVRRSDLNTRRGRNSGGARGPRQMYPAVCAQCGKETEVPFEPKGIKPVYCSECYAEQH